MNTEVLIAVITAAASLIGIILSNVIQGRALMEKMEKRFALADSEMIAKIEKLQATTDLRIDALTQEVRRHNNFAERVPALEERVSAIKESCKNGQK